MADIVLHGYAYSVYTRAVRMACDLKSVTCDSREIDPFDPGQAGRLTDLHPFGRVPIVDRQGRRFYETQAILDLIDTGFEGPALTPSTPEARARMRQVLGIADHYLYWPLVRQVFSHVVFMPLMSEAGDPAEIAAGRAAVPGVLDALEEIAQEGLVLNRVAPGLADCHLWPMLAYFEMVPGASGDLAERPALWAWMNWMRSLPVAVSTAPDIAVVQQG